MYFVMHCGGIPFNGDTIKTKSLGGSESAAYYMARELAAMGHSVILFTNERDTGTFDGVKYEWLGEVSDDLPLGDRFSFYAENTPHDVCIIQRHPRAFERKLASKQNFWWLHDLALYRFKDQVIGQMWNVDKVLCVSEYHKQQVMKVYGLPPEIVSVVNNGIDPALYECAPMKLDPSKRHLFYSSRPERGLIHLVKSGGIMEQLIDTDVHLHVCGYENTTPQMASQYEYLWARCAALPNVTNHGALSKRALAALQKGCQTWVYPTEFEEVSCITAMEAMTAGCGIVASAVAALPETCAGMSGSLIPLKDGGADVTAFVDMLRSPCLGDRSIVAFEGNSRRLSWKRPAESVCHVSRHLFADTHPLSVAHHFLRHSDIIALDELGLDVCGESALQKELVQECDVAYGFYRNGTYAAHYAAYYAYEKNRGVNYGPEDVTGTSRFRAVAAHVAGLGNRARVLDYGCAHGHYVVALARSFPQFTFTGADIAQSNLDIAQRWAEQEGLTNINFVKVDSVDDVKTLFDASSFNLIIAAEVVEHVGNPQHHIDTLASLLAYKGQMVLTTPFGPWEAQGYREHGYWRAHLHHFERADLGDMLGHHPEYKVVAAPSGMSQFHSALGSYIVSFGKPKEPSRSINYTRKIMQTMPDQTLTCCMIVRNGETDLRRCLLSVLPHVQELVIGVDPGTSDGTWQVLDNLRAENPLVGFNVFLLDKRVTESGFADARNATIIRASGDWILWLDADEVLTNGGTLSRYLRNSMYNGFAMNQHHFSTDPVGIIKTDIPCRLFRNHLGISFYGAVHEHPEIKLNEGLGPVSLMPLASIIHYGYVNEDVRKGRFSRNLPLLERDRKELPERLLGKFLWLRDLAQSCQYDIESNRVDPATFSKRIDEGFRMWDELMESNNHRLMVDALPYYSQLAILRKGGVDFSFAVDASLTRESSAEKQVVVHGYFPSKEKAIALMTALALSKVPELDRRYL